MRQHAWLLVSTFTFIGPSVNIGSIYLEPRSLIQEPESEKVFEMNKQAPTEFNLIGGEFSTSMENNKHFDFTPTPLSLSESRITLSGSTVSEAAFSESPFSGAAFSESATESTLFPFESAHSESSTSLSDPGMQLTRFADKVTHTITRSRVNPVTNENGTEQFDNSSFSHSKMNSLTNTTSSEDNSKFAFTSECACGDGETFSERRRNEERKRSEDRHKHEVFREMNRNGGFKSGLNGHKEVAGGGKVQKKNHLYLVGNLKELERRGKKEKDEDRIVNGYDVSGLARPWHASLVMKTKK